MSRDHIRIATVVPVRSTSTRLPGKVFKTLLGKPLLEQFIERIKRSRVSPVVVLATPYGQMSDFSEIQIKTKVFAFQHEGVEAEDVTGRLYFAGMAMGADLVIRINADNPCVDPDNVDMLVDAYMHEGDFKGIGTNLGDHAKSAWPTSLGAEIFPIGVLHWMHHNLSEPSYREHPHLFFHEKKRFYEPPCPYAWKPPLKFSVDTPKDLTRMRKIYKHFGHNNFSTTQLLEYCNDTEGRDSKHLPA